MGNRAIVVFCDKTHKKFSPAVYLHWNGGPESIYPFLDELDRRLVRHDKSYECARFIHVVGDFFDQDETTTLSLGVLAQPEGTLDFDHINPGDNGVYLVCRNGTREVRRFKDDYQDGRGFRELTTEEVDRECKTAYRDEYHDAITAKFKKLRPNVSES